MVLGDEKTIKTKANDVRQQIELTLFQPGSFTTFFKDQEVGQVKMYVAELMKNGKIAAIIQRYHQTEFVDRDKSKTINLSLQ